MSRRRTALLTTTAVLLVLLIAPGATAQSDGLQIEELDDDEYPVVELTVLVPETVGDTRLPKSAFAISEGDEPPVRPGVSGIAEPSEPDTLRAVLAIDTSGSMKGDAITRALDAATAFVADLPSGSEVGVVTFGDEPSVVVPPTSDLAQVRRSIQGITIEGRPSTALYNGVRAAANLLSSGDTSTIVVLSDGRNSVQGASVEEARGAVEQVGAQLWAVGLETSESDPDALARLAAEPDRVVSADDAAQLRSIYVDLASSLARQYVLRYDSNASGTTQIELAMEYANVSATAVRTFDIEGTPAPDAVAETDVAPQVADLEPFTPTVPLIATAPAYTVGLTALATASLIVWLLVLLPRRRQTRERLVSDSVGRNRPRLGSIAEWTTDAAERRLRGRRLGLVLDSALERAGLDLRVGELAVIVASLIVVAFATGMVAAGPLLAVLLAAIVPLGTRFALSMRRERRQSAFAEQLTDVLQLLGGTLRAGYGLLQGIDAVARDSDEPASGEFRRIIIEHRLGRDLSDAMGNCADRMGNADFLWVVQAIDIHRDVGGDLATVLDNIVNTVRDRTDVHRQVRALSAEGRMSATVLIGLPIAVLAFLQAFNPEYMAPLTAQPLGLALLASAALLMLIGSVWIRRLVRIRY